MSKFFIGVGLGISSAMLVPDSAWTELVKCYHAVNSTSYDLIDLFNYYSPSELNKRKSAEIKKQNHFVEATCFEFTDNKNDRKNVEFFNDIYQRMRIGEITSNQRGLHKHERVKIIRETLKDHFPEIFPDYEESQKKLMEKAKLEKKQNP